MQLTLNTRKSNIGTCPHGLPLGSCPICNGMAGSGSKKADFSAKPGEMSWNECAAIGAFLKAQKLAQQTRQQDALNYAQHLANFQKNLDKIQQNIINFNNIIMTNIPKIISAPIILVTQIFIQKPLAIIQNIPHIFTNLASKFADIASKITSVIGELKSAIDKKVSEKLSEFKKKINYYTQKECNVVVLRNPPATGAIIWAVELAIGEYPNEDIRNLINNNVTKLLKEIESKNA